MTFPAVNFTIEGYEWGFDPAYLRSEYTSGNTRQRKLMRKNNDIFSCSHVFTDAEASTMESYINVTLDKGSLTDTMPYYVSEVEFTGTGQILNGDYNLQLINKNLWQFTYQIEIIDRTFSSEQTIYEVVNALSGFENSKNIFDALEDMINYNNL